MENATYSSNYFYVLKEPTCQDEYKKMKLKLKHKNARSANIANCVYWNPWERSEYCDKFDIETNPFS